VAFAALLNLGCHVSHWDSILIYIIIEKFNSNEVESKMWRY
jgi:hypothetical protein